MSVEQKVVKDACRLNLSTYPPQPALRLSLVRLVQTGVWIENHSKLVNDLILVNLFVFMCFQ